MNKDTLEKWRHAFAHWSGWKAFGAACVNIWKAVRHWKGWRKLFLIPLNIVVPLFFLCTAALIWVFVAGVEQGTPAYMLYALSAYLLTALCVKLPAGIRGAAGWLERNPRISALVRNRETRFALGLYLEQFINFAYGAFKIVSGVVIGSAWIGADGIYNFVQALIQLFQILRRKNTGSMENQWKSYRFCGVLILLMHLTLTGIVFQMVNWNRVEEQGEIMIIATAAFAFYKFISSFMELAKDRKHTRPVDSSVRMLELSQAFFAIFSLQAGMLHTFGTGESWEHWLNLATGCMVCLLTAAMGVYMIHRGNREIRKIRERKNGSSREI